MKRHVLLKVHHNERIFISGIIINKENTREFTDYFGEK